MPGCLVIVTRCVLCRCLRGLVDRSIESGRVVDAMACATIGEKEEETRRRRRNIYLEKCVHHIVEETQLCFFLLLLPLPPLLLAKEEEKGRVQDE